MTEVEKEELVEIFEAEENKETLDQDEDNWPDRFYNRAVWVDLDNFCLLPTNCYVKLDLMNHYWNQC